MITRCAKSAGFCFGVKRAVDMVYEQIEKANEKKVYTYGPIIHNEKVVQDMQARGVIVIQSEAELTKVTEGIVIIRSHGVGKHIYDKLNKPNISLVDATCPFVKKIHAIVKEQGAAGRTTIIIGDEKHPEVIGIRGWASDDAIVVGDEKTAKKINVQSKKLCIVSQTTFNYKKFEELVDIIREKEYDIYVLNTICNATRKRQEEAKDIAEEVGAMLVIGDKRSSNTQKLFGICKKACRATYYIQTIDDLELNQLESVKVVGITAGASTPNTIIEEVQKKCQN